MKIDRNGLNAASVYKHSEIAIQKRAQADSCKNKFDSLHIENNGDCLSKDEFLKNLSKEISDKVKTATPHQTILQIKQEIDTGTFEVDTDDIVKKMLLGLGNGEN